MRRFVQIVAGAVAALYLAGGAFLYVAQGALLYQPQVTRVPASATTFALVRGPITPRGWLLNPGKPRS